MTKRLLWLPLVLAACGGNAATPPGAKAPTAAAPCPGEPPPGPGAETLLDHVPAAAVAAVLVPPGAFSWLHAFLDEYGGLRAELGAYLVSRVGVDLTRIDAIVVFATALGERVEAAVLLRMPAGGTPKLPGAGTHLGVELLRLEEAVVARVPSGMLLGTATAVKAGIGRALGQEPAVGEGAPLAALRQAPPSEFLAALHAPALADAEVAGMVARFQLRTGVLSYAGGRLRLTLGGSPQGLEAVRGLASGALAMATSYLEQQKLAATKEPEVAKGAAAIVAESVGGKLLAGLQPRLVDGQLVSELEVPLVGGRGSPAVAMAGILSAVAIPAFIKYTQRAKASEAKVNLRRIADGATAYYFAHEKGRRVPASVGWTPAAEGESCCGDANGDKCHDPAAWQHPTWKALEFAIDGPHFYQYRVVTAGKGKSATLTIEARGDLDCDGNLSTFRRTVRSGEHTQAESVRDELE